MEKGNRFAGKPQPAEGETKRCENLRYVNVGLRELRSDCTRQSYLGQEEE